MPGGALAPGPAPGRAGGPSGQPEEQMVTFQLEVIGPGAQARPAPFVGSLRVGLGNFTKSQQHPQPPLLCRVPSAGLPPGRLGARARTRGRRPARGECFRAHAAPPGSRRAPVRPPCATLKTASKRRRCSNDSCCTLARPGLSPWARARGRRGAARRARRRAPRSCRRRSSMRSPTCSPAALSTT